MQLYEPLRKGLSRMERGCIHRAAPLSKIRSEACLRRNIEDMKRRPPLKCRRQFGYEGGLLSVTGFYVNISCFSSCLHASETVTRVNLGAAKTWRV